MRYRTFALLIAVVMITMLTGCSREMMSSDNELSPLASVIETEMAPVRDAAEYEVKIYSIDPNSAEDTEEEMIPDGSVPMAQAPDDDANISKREAESIALREAGFTQDQVSYLYTRSKLDETVPHHVVSFHSGGSAYSFIIHAQTGEVLSDLP